MKTPNNTATKAEFLYPTFELITNFAQQKPKLDTNDYFEDYKDTSGIRAYNEEKRNIQRSLKEFNELMKLAVERIGIDKFEVELKEYLSTTSGRLELKNGKLTYCVGQYFPTEYRPAAARVLANVIWADYRDEKKADGTAVYNTAPEIRTAIYNRRILTRNTFKNYFN